MDANDACVSVAWGTNQTGCPWVWSWSLLIFVVPATYFGQWCSLYHFGLFERVRCLLISLVSSTKIDDEMVFGGAAILEHTYHWIVHLSFTVTTMCFNNPLRFFERRGGRNVCGKCLQPSNKKSRDFCDLTSEVAKSDDPTVLVKMYAKLSLLQK